MSKSNGASFRVYSCLPGQDASGELLNIGLAFPHEDGKGLDVVLQALPLTPRLVLREPDEAEQATADRPDLQPHREAGRSPSLKQQVDAFERALLERCLTESGGSISTVMQRLDVPRRTLSDKMERLGLDRRQFINGARNPSQASGKGNGEVAPAGGPRVTDALP